MKKMLWTAFIVLLTGLMLVCEKPVDPTPTIQLTSSQLVFRGNPGETKVGGKDVGLRNSGEGTLGAAAVAVAYSGASAGWLQTTLIGTGNGQRVANEVTGTSLALGLYAATVTVTIPGASNSPVSYAVEVHIRKAGPGMSLFVAPAENPVIADAVTQASQVEAYARFQVDALADPTDYVDSVVLDWGDGYFVEPDTIPTAPVVWLHPNVPLGFPVSETHWWVRHNDTAHVCTTSLKATTAQGGYSDTSVLVYILAEDESL